MSASEMRRIDFPNLGPNVHILVRVPKEIPYGVGRQAVTSALQGGTLDPNSPEVRLRYFEEMLALCIRGGEMVDCFGDPIPLPIKSNQIVDLPQSVVDSVAKIIQEMNENMENHEKN